MNAFGNAVRALFRRPVVVLFAGFWTLLFSLINYYNPFYTLLSGLGIQSTGGYFSAIISFLQLGIGLMTTPQTMLWSILTLIVILLAAACISGLVFSGYFYVIHNVCDRKEKFDGEFIYGIKRFFLRITWINMKALLWMVLLFLFLMVASVPAIVISRAWLSDKPELIAAALLTDVVTIAVLAVIFAFFRMYILFWYPAAYILKKRLFRAGKKVVDFKFWGIAVRFLLFDAVFVAFQWFILYLRSFFSYQMPNAGFGNALLLIGSWLFHTFFFSLLITFIFSAFRAYYADLKELGDKTV